MPTDEKEDSILAGVWMVSSLPVGVKIQLNQLSRRYF
jgi:hypothetical protein